MNTDELILDPAFWHNCQAPEARCGGGYFLPRFPAEVRAGLYAGARPRALDSCGVELRFASEAPMTRITLSAHGGPGEVLVWRGDLHCRKIQLPEETPVSLNLERPPRISQLSDSAPLRRRYSPELWRLEFGRGTIVFHSLESFGIPIRPPRPDEVPSKRWLAHGSSITHADASGYVAQAARRLGVDALNKGLSGSCHADIAAAEYFVKHERWDFATLELGVNMRGIFTPDEFRNRAHAFLELLHKSRPDAFLFVITHFTNAQHFPADQNAVNVIRQRAFDDALRQWVDEKSNPYIRLLEGRELLDEFTLLSSDLIHPGIEGHTRMGENLALKIAELTIIRSPA